MLASAQAQAGGFSRGDAPTWTEDLPIPEPIASQVALSPDGVYFLLSDSQIKWQGEDKFNYYRTVSKVIERAGLERTAAISFDFAPEFDDLTLLRLNVIRDGKVIEWRDRVKEDIFRRETQLESGIIDGTLTTFLQVPDLKVGDTVDVIWLRRSAPVIKGAAPAVREYLDFSVPVAETRVLVHWPKDVPLNVAALPNRIAHSATAEAEGQRLEWRLLAGMPNKWEDNTPVENNPDAILRISGDSNWSHFSALLAEYYDADYPLPPEWHARVDALKSLPRDKAAIAALRMVQDDIRYVSLSVGAGGIYARKPDEVIASGFGDCKDKALLYRVMLRQLGIDASVALTDLDDGYALPNELPQSAAFDHAIAQVKLNGETHWVDPTGSYEGGDFNSATQPDYGFALPLRHEGQAFLEPMPVVPERVWQTAVTETYSFNFMGLFLNVSTEYRGGAADWHRRKWAVKPAQEISEDFFDYYAGYYPGLVAPQTITMQDDRERNLLTTQETYFLSKAALNAPDLLTDFRFGADDFTSNLPDTPREPRQRPMTVGAPNLTSYITRILHAPIEFNPPEAVHLKNPGFQFDFSSTASEGGNMEMVWNFRRSGKVVAAADAAAVLRDGKEVSKNTSWSWDLSPEGPDQ